MNPIQIRLAHRQDIPAPLSAISRIPTSIWREVSPDRLQSLGNYEYFKRVIAHIELAEAESMRWRIAILVARGEWRGSGVGRSLSTRR